MNEIRTLHDAELTLPGAGPVLEIERASKTFRFKHGSFGRSTRLVAVREASLRIFPGQTVAIIGESGCGKSTLGRLATGELLPDDGSVMIAGRPVQALERAEKARLVQPIPQDPKAALDPRWTIGRSLAEPLRLHRICSNGEIAAAVEAALARVGLGKEIAARFPREVSGGEAQRVVIARALLLSPKVLVCDEAVSALDAAVQSEIIDLLLTIQKREQTALVFISHDLKLVGRIADRIEIMYLGEVVESLPAGGLGRPDRHPYTSALTRAMPRIGRGPRDRKRATLAGEVPSPIERPDGCVFHPRCSYAVERCRTIVPPSVEVARGHCMKCHLAGTIALQTERGGVAP